MFCLRYEYLVICLAQLEGLIVPLVSEPGRGERTANKTVVIV